MQRQVVLLASRAEGSISAWDLHSGTLLTSYKGNGSPANGLSLLGRDYLVATQVAKPALHFWTWHKDAVLQRSFTTEPMLAVAASGDGAYIAAGGGSGSLYLWEAGSGRLLHSWPAHYKSATVVCFVPGSGCGGSSVLVSGGEDTRVMAWLLPELLDQDGEGAAARGGQGGGPQPAWCWSDHTLPVTALATAGGGSEAGAVVVSASLDRTVKLRRVADGAMLLSVALPSPINALAVDRGEQALWAGCADGGVYQVPLLPGGPAAGGPGAAPGTSAAQGGPSAAASSSGAGWNSCLQGHGRAVTSLALCGEGEALVSGSEDGTARVWDLRSRQPVQVLSAPGKLAVSAVLVLRLPQHMHGAHTGAGGAGEGASSSGHGHAGGRSGPRRPQPLAPLVKYTGMAGTLQPWEGAPVVVVAGSAPLECMARSAGLASTSQGASSSSSAATDQLFPLVEGTARGGTWEDVLGVSFGAGADDSAGALCSGLANGGSQAHGGGAAEVERLRAELAEAQAAAGKWRGLHAKLHRFASGKLTGKGGVPAELGSPES